MSQSNSILFRIGMWFGLLAALLHALGYVVYGLDVLDESVHTNTISWFLWVTGTIISYLIIRDIAKDWAISLLNGVCALGMINIFGLICYQIYVSGRPFEATFDARADIPIAALDFVTMGIWIWFRKRNIQIVNIAFQVDIFLSFVPIMRATIQNPFAETLLPWIIWTCAYLVQIFCVVCRANQENKESIDTPLHYFGWHFAMVLAIIVGVTML